ncbi:PREDICTED: uncharacterized protein LOC108762507 [Trachymyrmex cornetzi]|nr:PREDICTED: uncharacterized protein LOC108762507 [Trachymyrmex cornetzi]
MAEEIENLILAQEYKIGALKRVLINYKKLPKTATSGELKSQPYFVDNVILEAEDVYANTSDILQNALSRLLPANINSSLSDSHDESVSRESGSQISRLPRISLPKFTGKIAEWESFRNMFESLVACNVSLSKVQKFHYLKTSVTGEAAVLINSLKISEANYDSAWQLLIDEYDDKQTLVYTHLHAFASLPVMKTENVNDLQKLCDTVSSSLTALKNLDRPVNEWDDLLVYLIAQKFSPRTRSEWNLKRTEFAKLSSYKDINDFLTLRIRGLCDLSDSPKDTRRYRDDKPRSSVNNVTANKCVGCSGNHSVSKCKEFLDKTVEQRGAFARQSRLCLNCLRSGHFLQQCPSKSRCSHCSRSHHSLLHFSNNVKADATANSSKIRAEA